MGWQDLLQAKEVITLPWLGGRELTHGNRHYLIDGRTPFEQGWHRFEVGGSQKARWLGAGELDPAFEEGRTVLTGYIAGGRLIPDDVPYVADMNHLPLYTRPLYLLEPSERFSRVDAVDFAGRLLFLRPAFGLGPEAEVQAAYEDRRSIREVAGVTPALELAFRFECWVRAQEEAAVEAEAQRQAAAEAARIEEERQARALAELERLQAARREQEARLRAQHEAEIRRMAREQPNIRRWRSELDQRVAIALARSGGELLDVIQTHRGLVEVRFRFEGRRFSCVINPGTLGIVEAGICLSADGIRGDTLFTLESLPAVIREAIQTGRLVVTRRI